MSQKNSPLFARLNLASFYKIELSCQRFINMGSYIVRIGGILSEDTIKQNKRFGPIDMKSDLTTSENSGLFNRTIFGPSREELGQCLCGLTRQRNSYSVQALIRDNDTFYWNTVCSVCHTEYMSVQSRMDRMGFITLPKHVLHVWYLSYISRILMCHKNFLFSCLYGGRLTTIAMDRGPIVFLSRKDSKRFVIDGEITRGVIIPRANDKLLRYDAVFFPRIFIRPFVNATLREDVSSFLKTKRVFDFSSYQDLSYKNFAYIMKYNTLFGGFTAVKKDKLVPKQNQRKQYAKVFQNLLDLRKKHAYLGLLKESQVSYTTYDITNTQTYNKIQELVFYYKKLSIWIEYKLFYLHKHRSKLKLLKLYTIKQNLLFFRQKRELIIEYLHGRQGQYIASSLITVGNTYTSLNTKTEMKRQKRRFKIAGRVSELRQQKGTKRWFCKTCGNKLQLRKEIRKYKIFSKWIEPWKRQKKISVFTRYMGSLEPWNKNSIFQSSVPNIIIPDVERNWVYEYDKLRMKEIPLTYVSSLYNNYWEFACVPKEHMSRECQILFFASDRVDSFSESVQCFYQDKYETFFIMKPRHVWHQTHFLPFNLKQRSYTSWKEMFTQYVSPSVASGEMVTFMLQSVSDTLLRDHSRTYSKFPKESFKQHFYHVHKKAQDFVISKVSVFFILFSLNRLQKKVQNKKLQFMRSAFIFIPLSLYNSVHTFSVLRFTFVNRTYIKSVWTSFNLNNARSSVNVLDSQGKHKYSRTLRQRSRERLSNVFRRGHTRFEWMSLLHIPVLPVNSRPIVTIGEGSNRVTIRSEINNLYNNILYRSKWLARMEVNKSIYPMYLRNTNGLLLQQSIEKLFGNPFAKFSPGLYSRSQEKNAGISLLDRLKGKFGRLRRQLLGKRVDYSGRSVIVVGPSLEMNMCAIPVEMAFHILQPLLIHTLTVQGIAPSLTGAKKMISTSHPKVRECLEELVQNELVLLNRAPTLHRMNFQSFYITITNQRAILLHPLVCSSFNADFDGDQMAVHLPLSIESRLEARIIMMASHNILSPATGDPGVLPTQDMVLGCYYLTFEPLVSALNQEIYIQKSNDITVLSSTHDYRLHTWVWLNHVGNVVFAPKTITPLLEMRLYSNGLAWSVYPSYQKIDNYFSKQSTFFVGTTLGRLIFNKVLGYGTITT